MAYTDDGHGSGGIFISYRRDDTAGQAHAIRDRLVQRYGAERVFMDVNSIVPGSDFAQRIEEELGSIAAMLVLIGPHWERGAEGSRRLDDPSDFVRREVKAALERKIPTIPILVDGALLPNAEELPKSIRPLVRMQAVTLRNASWDYDLSRILTATERQVRPTSSLQQRWLSPPRRKVFAATAAAAVVISIGVVVPATWSGPAHKPTEATPVSARSAVSAVASPDRLTEQLLDTPFASADVPNGTAPTSTQLLAAQSSLSAPGLTTTVNTMFSDTANSVRSIGVSYLVFASDPNASAYFDNYSLASALGAYKPTGSRFSTLGIGDLTHCQVGRETIEPRWAEWYCLTLSGNVLSSSKVIEGDGGIGAALESELARDAVRHLESTAAAVSSPSVPPPQPGNSSLNANALFEQLTSPFPSGLIPAGLESASRVSQRLQNPPLPPGLVYDKYIEVAFKDAGTNYNFSYISFSVFDTTQEAESWFNAGLAPFDPSGKLDQPNSTVIPSGLPPGEQAQCGTYSQKPVDGYLAQGESACFVQWGDVIIEAETTENATPRNPRPTLADSNMALTLARSALLRVSEAMGS